MRVRGITRLRRYGRRVAELLLPGGLILNYHRVAEPGVDPWELCVSPEHFEQHLEVVRRLGRPMRLSRLIEKLKDGKPLKGAVAMTFDDGYEDNYRIARPLLEKYDIPATIFVVSGALGFDRGFWWDELGALVLRVGDLPPVIELAIREKTHRIELHEATQYGEHELKRDLVTKVWQAQPRTRLHFFNRLWALLRRLSASEQVKLMDQIREWAGDAMPVCADQRPLSAQNLCEIAKGGLIEIGGHTVSHPMLSCHSDDYQLDEIRTDKAALEELVGSSLTSFAYPFGSYDQATVRLVKSAGYLRACTTVEGHVRRGSDPFLLPRCRVRNWSGEEFARRLFGWTR